MGFARVRCTPAWPQSAVMQRGNKRCSHTQASEVHTHITRATVQAGSDFDGRVDSEDQDNSNNQNGRADTDARLDL